MYLSIGLHIENHDKPHALIDPRLVDINADPEAGS